MPARTASAPAAAAPRKPSTRKAPPRPPVTEPAVDEEMRPTPLVVLNRDHGAAPPERVLVFEIDDRGFYAPAVPPAGLLLRYLKNLRAEGPGIASLDLIESMCGADAYEAVAADPQLTTEDISAITAALRKLLLGRPEDPKA